jgi:hypothetical protein
MRSRSTSSKTIETATGAGASLSPPRGVGPSPGGVEFGQQAAPFSGIKRSGYWRELSHLGIHEFVRKLIRATDVDAPCLDSRELKLIRNFGVGDSGSRPGAMGGPPRPGLLHGYGPISGRPRARIARTPSTIRAPDVLGGDRS